MPDNFTFVLVEAGSICCLSVSSIIPGSAIFSADSVPGFSGEFGIPLLLVSASLWLSRKLSDGVRCEAVLLSPESRSISGISAFSAFGSVWFVISALSSVRSGGGCSVCFFFRSVRVLVFSSFSF